MQTVSLVLVAMMLALGALFAPVMGAYKGRFFEK
jgi:hypothetical protein